MWLSACLAHLAEWKIRPGGRTIYPSYFVHLLDGFSGIEQFQFEQQAPGSIVLRLCAGQDIADTVEQSLKLRIQVDLGDAMSFRGHGQGSIVL